MPVEIKTSTCCSNGVLVMGRNPCIPLPVEVVLPEPVAHCTDSDVEWLVDPNDPDCLPIKHTFKCFSDGSETHEFLMPDGSIITDPEDAAVANAKPYTAPVMTEVCEEAQVEDFYMLGGTKADVQEFIDEAIAALSLTIADPADAAAAPAAVDLTAADQEVCSWTVNVMPCGTDVNLTADGTNVIVLEGDDKARIGGLVSTGDGDPAEGGSDTSVAVAEYGPTTVFQVCATIKHCASVKA